MASVTPADRWTRLVRDTLEQLQAQLLDDEVSVAFDGRRYVLRADGQLQPYPQPQHRDVAGDSAGVLSSPPPEPRSHKGLLSPYTLASESGDVNVPFWAIIRDYKVVVTLPDGACRGCAHPDCAHGWPRVDLLNPAAVVVLRLREGHDDCAHGWYLRAKGGNALVELPRAVRRGLIDLMERHEQLRTSQLLGYNAWSHGDEDNFHDQACERFLEYRCRVRAAVKLSKKRKARGTDQEADYMAGEPDTCVVCLDDGPTARARCRTGTCTAKVCEVCHADSRGLCPICDRTAINADYACGRCYERTPLLQYGYECIGCGDHALCKTCYSKFRECCACESS